MEKIEVREKCYRLHFDLPSALKQSFHQGYDFLDRLSTIGSVLVQQGSVAVWLQPTATKKTLLKTLRSLGVEEVYCEEITLSNVQNEQSSFSAWFLEHYAKQERLLMEEANQQILRDCMKRIDEAKLALSKNIEEGAKRGGKENFN